MNCIFKVVIQWDWFDRDPDTDHYWLDIGIWYTMPFLFCPASSTPSPPLFFKFERHLQIPVIKMSDSRWRIVWPHCQKHSHCPLELWGSMAKAGSDPGWELNRRKQVVCEKLGCLFFNSLTYIPYPHRLRDWQRNDSCLLFSQCI